MAIHRILLNGTALAATLLLSSAAMAQTVFHTGGGTITYTGPAPDLSFPGEVGLTPTASSVVVSGVSGPAINIGPTNDPSLSLSVVFTGAPSSLGQNCTFCDGMGIAQFGPSGSTVGDLSLDTTAAPGNTFRGEDAIDIEASHGSGDVGGNVTINTGADTIIASSESGGTDGIYASGARVTVNTAAAISAVGADYDDGIYTSGNQTFVTLTGTVSAGTGIESFGATSSSITVSGSVTGTAASVQFDGSAANTLTLATGASLSGDAVGNTGAGASNALILQGHGTATNNFKNFSTLEVQNGGGGAWSLQGTSSFSGALTVDAGGALTQNAGSNSFASSLNAGSLTVAANTLTVTGNLENTGFVTIGSGATLAVGSYNQDCASCGTLINHGTLDPASIEIDGGSFGGAGTVIGDVTLNGATLQAGDAAGGNLAIDGSYAQTGGNIVFYIDPNGTGGFDVSSLTFTPGESLSLNGVDIDFDFGGGADPLAFLHSGEFDLDSFFKSGSGDPFGADFDLTTLFAGDTFSIEAPGVDVTSFDFDPGRGVLALAESAVPEPATWAMFLIGFGAIGWTLRNRRRPEGHRRALGAPFPAPR